MSFKIITFGCRLNAYESEAIRELLKENFTENELDNLTLFNSCAVTLEAERQLKQAIRKEKKDNPNGKIGVLGCAVQINKDDYLNMPEVDFAFGNISKMELENYKNLDRSIILDNLDNSKNKQNLVSGFEGRVRGFLQIQNGCNNACTFCVTRLARGKSISINPKKIIEQINILVNNGYKELFLTGINITDYNFDGLNLGKLLKNIIKETRIERLGLSSLDVACIDKDLEEIIKNEERILPHLHLSLQSGDNEILKKMARRHTREIAIDFCNRIKKARKDVLFGADLIAGFPTETDEAHNNSLKIINECNIVFGHIFPYSERPGTIAADMQQVDKHIRKLRAKELREKSKENLQNCLNSYIGKEVEILMETENLGRTRNYLNVSIDTKKSIGELIKAKITGKSEDKLIANIQ